MSRLFSLDNTVEREAVRLLGDQIGYGNMMVLARDCWRDNLASENIAGGEFAVGPCVAQTVPCGCKDQAHCDWCCGSGWLTKHVKHIKDAMDLSK